MIRIIGAFFASLVETTQKLGQQTQALASIKIDHYLLVCFFSIRLACARKGDNSHHDPVEVYIFIYFFFIKT